MKQIFLEAAKRSYYRGNGIGYLERNSLLALSVFWKFDEDFRNIDLSVFKSTKEFTTAFLLIAECIDDMDINDFTD